MSQIATTRTLEPAPQNNVPLLQRFKCLENELSEFSTTSSDSMQLKDASKPTGDSGHSLSDKLSREGSLLASIPGEIGSGIVDRAQDVLQHKVLTGLEVASSFAVAAGLTYFSKDPGFIGNAARFAPKVLLGLTAADLGRRLGGPMWDTWQHPGNLQHDESWLGQNLGSAVVDYPLVALGGFAGDSVASGLVDHFDPVSDDNPLGAKLAKHSRTLGRHALNAPIAEGVEALTNKLFPSVENPSFPLTVPAAKISTYVALPNNKSESVISGSGLKLTDKNPTSSFGIDVAQSGPVRLDLKMDGPGTDWSKTNDESAVVSVYVDGKYNQDMVLFAGANNEKYSFDLYNLPAGKHSVTLRYASEKSTPDSTGIDVNSGTAEQYTPANNTDKLVDEYSPELYGLNGIENNHQQVPMALYHSQTMNANGSETINYGYVYSNEDGGTGGVPAVEQARWGRMTDIENVMDVTVDPKSGALENITYQGANDTWHQFQGSFDGTHPIIRTSTANDDVSDSEIGGDLLYKFEPDYQVPSNAPAEELQRENPLWWQTSSAEIEREGKVDTNGDGDPPNDSGVSEVVDWLKRYALGDVPKMGDPRNYVYIEQEQSGATASDPIADEIVLKNGKSYVSDFGYKDVAIGRNGWSQTDVLLPPGTKASDISQVKFLSRGAGSVKVDSVGHIYMLNSDYVPRDIQVPVDTAVVSVPDSKS